MKHLFVCLLCLVALAACGAADTPTNTPVQAEPTQPAAEPAAGAPNDPLAEMVITGGMCIVDEGKGGCETALTIRNDGTTTYVQNGGEPKTFTLQSEQLRSLRQQIASADFPTIAATPFTDTCPRAFDGQAATYTFYTDAGSVSLDACETAIDPAHPLFQLMQQLLEQASQA